MRTLRKFLARLTGVNVNAGMEATESRRKAQLGDFVCHVLSGARGTIDTIETIEGRDVVSFTSTSGIRCVRLSRSECQLANTERYARLAIIVVLILLFGAPTFAQTAKYRPLPSVEQCRADAASWSFQFQQDKQSIPTKRLDPMTAEMTECSVSVDPDPDPKNIGNTLYDKVWNLGEVEIAIRASDFLRRHHLMEEFFKEGAR